MSGNRYFFAIEMVLVSTSLVLFPAFVVGSWVLEGNSSRAFPAGQKLGQRGGPGKADGEGGQF